MARHLTTPTFREAQRNLRCLLAADDVIPELDEMRDAALRLLDAASHLVAAGFLEEDARAVLVDAAECVIAAVTTPATTSQED